MSFRKYTFFVLFLAAVQLYSQKLVEINFINANKLFTTEQTGPDLKIFAGEVCFQHDSTYFYCDSALYNTKKKTINAFGNIVIQIIQPNDTIYAFCDTLFYDGNARVAQMLKNVRFVQDSNELTTNYLDYYIDKKYARYYNNGRIISGKDTLYSEIGYYYTQTKDVFFKNNVKIYGKKNKIFTDTIEHNLDKKISILRGPTQIIADTTKIFANTGFYDHYKEYGFLSKRTKIISGQHSIEGDSLYYNRRLGIGKAFGSVEIIDTIETLILRGNYGEYHEKGQKSLMTDNALFIDISNNDTLWLHADTLFSYIDTLKDVFDTIPFRLVFAYHHVKAYKNDLQLKCDSLVFSQLDSVFMMFGSPVLWSGNQQLVGDYIELYMHKNDPKEMYVWQNAIVAEKIDSVNFNIIKAEDIKVVFNRRQIATTMHLGKVEALYFLQDDADSTILGIGKLSCDTMHIIFNEGKIHLLKPFIKPKGKIYPPNEIPPNEKKINGFRWYNNARPKRREDVFVW